MNKKTMLVLALFVVAMSLTVNAYAGLGGENCPVHGFFSSVGGFLYNALPWNWGNWFGK